MYTSHFIGAFVAYTLVIELADLRLLAGGEGKRLTSR